MTRDNVERVARVVMEIDQGGPLGYFAHGEAMRDTLWEDFDERQHEHFRAIARAAMAATLELTAEDLREPAIGFADHLEVADWLLSRANELKETGGE